MISIIAIIGKNRAIGKNNKLLWHIPEDMARFKKLTTGQTVIMGRITYESIDRSLPHRRNIIITRNKNFKLNSHVPHSRLRLFPAGKNNTKDCEVVNSLEKALANVKTVPSPYQGESQGEVFVIGGGQIYKEALPYAQKLYLTIVDDEPEADTYFPNYSEFKKIIREEKKEYQGLKYKFIELEK